ncbi:MAG: anti-sigma factor antagonist [Firmicutes bacterium]|nr:anti-sigma factor antagonist [Bacillota bacterium]
MELLLSGKYKTLIVKIYGELDDRAAGDVKERVDRELARTGAVNVAFDFGAATFMDSSGIGVIIGRYRVTRALGGRVIIYGASDTIKRIIAMSGIGDIVIIADSLEDGIKEAALNV